MPAAEAGSVLGIDVGFSPTKRSSAVCRLDWDAAQITWTIRRFRALPGEREATILAVAGSATLQAAAFDGPLRQELDIIGRYRTAERMLTRRLTPLIGKPGQSSTPVGRRLNAAANDCAQIVRQNCAVGAAHPAVRIGDLALYEAFPSSFLGLMIDHPTKLEARRADRSDLFFEHLLADGTLHRLCAHLLPARTLRDQLAAVTNHDGRAALICALTALAIAATDFTAVGDAIDGWIILPPASLIRPWARAALEANARELHDNYPLVTEPASPPSPSGRGPG